MGAFFDRCPRFALCCLAKGRAWASTVFCPLSSPCGKPIGERRTRIPSFAALPPLSRGLRPSPSHLGGGGFGVGVFFYFFGSYFLLLTVLTLLFGCVFRHKACTFVHTAAFSQFGLLSVAGMAVAREVFEHLFAEVGRVEMGVDFGRADVLMAEHGLDGGQRGAALE